MTPLARRIVKNLTLPVKDRCQTDYGGLLHKMDDVHCFGITEALPLVRDLAWNVLQEEIDVGGTCFLPASKTWIEYEEDGFLHGYLLLESSDRSTCSYHFAGNWSLNRDGSARICPGNEFVSTRAAGGFPLGQSQKSAVNFPHSVTDPRNGKRFKRDAIGPFLIAALALINTPRLIGRRQHMPHRGLERRLLKQQRSLGHFPLHAWSEIKLEVTPPEDASGSPPTEAHLTGRKALHFCRAHLRVRNGRVEIVRGHWRGDASLGIKRSRYRLTGASA